MRVQHSAAARDIVAGSRRFLHRSAQLRGFLFFVFFFSVWVKKTSSWLYSIVAMPPFNCQINKVADVEQALVLLKRFLDAAPLFEDPLSHDPAAVIYSEPQPDMPEGSEVATIHKLGPDSWVAHAGDLGGWELKCNDTDCIVGALREKGLPIQRMEFFREGADFAPDLLSLCTVARAPRQW
jgi:hypothetical protein